MLLQMKSVRADNVDLIANGRLTARNYLIASKARARLCELSLPIDFVALT